MSPLATPEVVALLRQAATVARRSWRPLLVTDLAYKLLAFAILTPLVGVALRAGVWLSGQSVLADQEILFFALRPGGLLVFVAVAALGLAIAALEQASLMAIGACAAARVRITTLQSLGWVVRRAPQVVALTLRLVGRALLLAAPFLAGIGIVYLVLLREHDINFYLQEKPPVFLLAVGLVVGLEFLAFALEVGAVFIVARKTRIPIPAARSMTEFKPQLRPALAAAGFTLLVVVAIFLSQPVGLTSIFTGLCQYLAGWGATSGKSSTQFLFIWLFMLRCLFYLS